MDNRAQVEHFQNKGSDNRYDDRLLLNVCIDIIVYNYVQNSLHIGI